jgi:hypothetical protein
MATIVGKVVGPFTFLPGQSYNYWFRPHNGAWQSFTTIDKDPATIYPIARPWLPYSWDIEGDEVTVLLEEDTSVTPPRYRHAYALNVQNHSKTDKRSFFIATSELKP